LGDAAPRKLYKVLAKEPKPLVDVDALYERLVHRYSTVYGRGVWVIEREIQSYMKGGPEQGRGHKEAGGGRGDNLNLQP